MKNILSELKNKMLELIDSIDLGETDITKSEAYDLLTKVSNCCNRKLYKFEVIQLLNIDINKFDELYESGKIPKAHIDKNGFMIWYLDDIKKLKV